MKSSLEEKEILSTTPNVKNISNLPAKENSYLFNRIQRLSGDYNVSVSNTMIKVTYKKALKDHYASCNNIEFSKDSVLIENSMNSSLSNTNISKNKNKIEASEFMLVPKNVNWNAVKKPESHSSHKHSKEPPIKTKKKLTLSVSMKKLVSKSDEISQENLFLKPNTLPSPDKKVNNEEESQNCKVKIKSNSAKNNVEKKLTLKSQKNKNGTFDKTKKEGKKVSIKKTEVNCKSVKRKLVNSKERAKKVKVSGKSLAKAGKNRKKPILFNDPELPSGWSRYIRIRDKGTPNEKHIVYVVSPKGKMFRFKWKLRQYLEKTNSKLDADQFFFGLYKRGKSAIVLDSKKKSEVSSSAKANLVMGNSSSKSGSKFVIRARVSKSDISKIGKTAHTNGKELLLYDPDLPFGWKRIINSNGPNGKLQVHIISPEGRIFRRKYRLNQYLKKHQYTHNLDRFYFGLYPKKNSSEPDVIIEEEEDELLDYDSSGDDDDEENSTSEKGALKYEDGSPMYDDPNLPEGWKRYIKIRSYGESAGRMEVVILSPDGRRHTTRKHLENYIQQNNLDHRAEDFDFSVFGKTKKNLTPEPKDLNSNVKIRIEPYFVDKAVTDLKEEEATPERQLVNAVSGLMIACDSSTARSERRSRLPQRELEKLVREHLRSEDEVSINGCDIPERWIQRLVKCRSNIRTLEPDAVSAIAEKTKDFIKEISQRAFQISRNPEEGLQYEDVADLVENSKCLAPLKTLIPQKITYKKFLRLNRPKQFFSFT